MKEAFEGKMIGTNEIVRGELIINGLIYWIRSDLGYGTSTVAVYPDSVRKVDTDGLCKINRHD
ncbi:hypothetical protein [Absicoccus intestinalis]|uniref:Uncharacterized protein n=1 Tax=Absicoccus intestinalis TaxID=2926319 RepID=A0ABU4WMY6_9FIRM|nr:hypothetical protein [Absicoccus sp. CLA-KB-P134]MDX8417386.1 hypothetical protein [Absicoccus sp. CLA-KB-P134]